jgi:cytoskeletal protein CcmA (bactofilin family)
MFNLKKKQQNMAKHIEPDPTSINLIGTGTVIKGEVNSTGDIRIDGTLTGQVKCKGKIVVGATGVLEGEIFCQNADLSGQINGKVEVAELLTLKASARFSGDMITNKLAIEPGANFTGTCTMDKTIRQTEVPAGNKKPVGERVSQ